MKRKIKRLRDLHDGKILDADKWLDTLKESEQFKLRRQLKREYKEEAAHIVCEICGSPVYLAGSLNQELYFKHWRELGDCPIKTKGKYSQRDIDRMRFNGAKESRPHIEIKEHLYKYLSIDSACSDVKKEEVIKSEDVVGWWKKPDLSLIFKNMKVVIEIQLSTTYIDVIVERDLFYEKNKIFIMWVFDEKEISRFRFTEKDIFYDNNRNAFLITSETKILSEKSNKLKLLCYYQKPFIENGEIRNEWRKEIISVDELKFDREKYKAYYFNYNEEIDTIKKDILLKLIEEFESYWIVREKLDEDERTKKDDFFIKRLNEQGVEVENFHHKLKNVLNALYSTKHGRIIGYRFPNFLGLSNCILNNHPEFTYIYLWALESYGLRNEVEHADSFNKKVSKYKKEKPEQCNEYNKLLRLLFRKLSEKIKPKD